MVGLLLAVAALAQGASAPTPQVRWSDCLAQPPPWYAGAEAVRVADNVLLYQRETGGWPKNIDMAAVLSETEKAGLARQKPETDSTIDNGATHTQLRFLAKVYDADRHERHKQAFLKGVDYLLEAQYANGGWPQYYPLRPGYYTHISFNDDAMTGVLELLRDIARQKAPYGWVDAERRSKAARAVEKGTECILETQVVVNGRRTVWCAQHDEVTLQPASARAYEHVSLSGHESVGIVRFLMDIDPPGERVKQAIESAASWFEQSRLEGIRWLRRPSSASVDGFEYAVVADAAAGPLWARFYEIGTNRPIFSGRDGVLRYNVAEIEEERRNHYRWYVDTPTRLLAEEYPSWRKKWLTSRDR